MKYVAALFAALAVLVLGGGVVRADVNDFVIHHFDAKYVLNNDVPGGSLVTAETIDLTFSDNNHGILRALPKSYQGNSTKLKVNYVKLDGRTAPYTTYAENNNLVLKIGDPNSTITGSHRYEIGYYQERVINFVGDKPELYWDVNGDQWKQSFEKVTASLEVRPQILANSASCYAGPIGSSESSGVCTIERSSIEKFDVATLQPLKPNETLTFAVDLSGATFAPVTWQDKLADYKRDAVGLLIGFGLAIFAFISWLKNGRDYPGRKIIVPEYEPPKGLTPAEVGMLADYKVDGRDLSATLIDLAVRGYVRIHEDVSKIIFITTRSYSVELRKADQSGLKFHEKNLLEGIFGNYQAGEVIKLSQLNRSTMYSKVQSARKDIKKSLMDSYGYLESKSDKKMTVFLVIGFALFFAAFFAFSVLGAGGVVGLIIGACGFLAFGSAMQRRSHAGVEMLEKILGLKLYMNVAEKDRLAKMQSVQRPFAEPTKTPELYEKLLPFAVALGVEKSWSKQFDGILTQSPGWVTSNATVAGFSSAHLASSISSVTSSFSQSFQASSGSSGSGGGGSSGGGGGGGGGGGW